ncbi:MAG TPA: hypothetical protein VHX39_05445 [Acetobacteraceae bacterium]|nr:hypothetical protein [Acetobacteraceae bacterium]
MPLKVLSAAGKPDDDSEWDDGITVEFSQGGTAETPISAQQAGIHYQSTLRRDPAFVIRVLVTRINISTLPRLSPEQVRG